MNRAKFFLLVCFLMLGIYTAKNVEAIGPSGLSHSYSHYFSSSGWNTPRYMVMEINREVDGEPMFGTYAVLQTISGINPYSEGNPNSDWHDVTFTGYVLDDSRTTEYKCFLNSTGTGTAILDSLHITSDGEYYQLSFREGYMLNTVFRFYFKKAWNDCWSGTLSGNFYAYSLESI